MPTNTPNLKIPKPLGSENVSRAALNTIYDTIDTNVAAMPTFAMSRQAIINGNFDVWQRGTSFTNPSTIYSSDRWQIIPAGSGNPTTVTYSRLALNPGDISSAYYGYRVSVDGGGSVGMGQTRLVQRVENGVRNLCGNGKKITLSFWARSSITNKRIGVYFAQNYGTGGSAGENISGNNFTLSSTWQKFSVTVTTSSLVGKTVNSDDMLVALFCYTWDSGVQTLVGASSAETFVGAGTIDIAQVQLCAGDVALPFQPRSFNEELVLCQRYFESCYTHGLAPSNLDNAAAAMWVANSTGNLLGTVSYRVPKRISSHTVQIYSYNSTLARVNTAYANTNIGTNVTASRVVEKGFISLTDASNPFTVGTYYWFGWTADAEL